MWSFLSDSPPHWMARRATPSSTLTVVKSRTALKAEGWYSMASESCFAQYESMLDRRSVWIWWDGPGLALPLRLEDVLRLVSEVLPLLLLLLLLLSSPELESSPGLGLREIAASRSANDVMFGGISSTEIPSMLKHSSLRRVGSWRMCSREPFMGSTMDWKGTSSPGNEVSHVNCSTWLRE